MGGKYFNYFLVPLDGFGFAGLAGGAWGTNDFIVNIVRGGSAGLKLPVFFSAIILS